MHMHMHAHVRELAFTDAYVLEDAWSAALYRYISVRRRPRTAWQKLHHTYVLPDLGLDHLLSIEQDADGQTPAEFLHAS